MNSVFNISLALESRRNSVAFFQWTVIVLFQIAEFPKMFFPYSLYITDQYYAE